MESFSVSTGTKPSEEKKPLRSFRSSPNYEDTLSPPKEWCLVKKTEHHRPGCGAMFIVATPLWNETFRLPREEIP